MDFADGCLRLGQAGPVAVLELARVEKRNALTRAMWAALPAVAAALREDGARALLLRGAGTRAFSAGADIAEFAEAYATPEAARATNDAIRAGIAALAELPLPVVALVHGPCMGAGVALALAADLRFAAEDAAFAIPPARLGIAYPFADVAALVALLGPARTKDLLFSARTVGAPEALAMGLVDRVLPAAAAEAAALDWAGTAAALSPSAIAVMKAQVAASGAEPPALRAAFDAAFSGPDFAEGRRAFHERRPPRF